MKFSKDKAVISNGKKWYIVKIKSQYYNVIAEDLKTGEMTIEYTSSRKEFANQKLLELSELYKM